MFLPAWRGMGRPHDNSGFVCDKTVENYEQQTTFSPVHTWLLYFLANKQTLGHWPWWSWSWGCGDQMCDTVWQSQDNNNNGILEPSEELLLRCEETDHLWSITFYVKRGCGEILRDLLKSVTLTWQQRDNRQVPTALEHYWSIVLFSRRGSFCRQAPYYCDTDSRQGEKLGAKRKKDCQPWSGNWRWWQGFLLLRSDSKYKRWRGRSIMIKGLTTTDIFKVF